MPEVPELDYSDYGGVFVCCSICPGAQPHTIQEIIKHLVFVHRMSVSLFRFNVRIEYCLKHLYIVKRLIWNNHKAFSGSYQTYKKILATTTRIILIIIKNMKWNIKTNKKDEGQLCSKMLAFFLSLKCSYFKNALVWKMSLQCQIRHKMFKL